MAHFDSDIMDGALIVTLIESTSSGCCKGEATFELG